MRILITGGAGFIGSALARDLILNSDHQILVFDKLTYAGTMASLKPVEGNPRFDFLRGDICDPISVRHALLDFRPDIITHLAAESHVDRSIDSPGEFVRTNLVGTYTLLAESLAYWRELQPSERTSFRFHHISTDEVFGSLGPVGHFTETTNYDPRSPYSASKAGSDYLALAWSHTYGLPILLTNCSNNYGPYHFPEKMIPLMIVRALADQMLPVYGRGENVRDWLFVDDHVHALRCVFERGTPGRRYNIGGNAERRNIDVVQEICAILDKRRPRVDGRSYADQIGFVADRPGHDLRYAIDATRIREELGWKPKETFESGLEKTVTWYLENESWWRPLLSRDAPSERRGVEA